MIISKQYKNEILKKVGAKLNIARRLSKMDIGRVSKLTTHARDTLQGVEEGNPGSFQKLRADDLVMLLALYGKELVIAWQDLPLEERYGNLRYYSQAELRNFLQQEQDITY